MKKIYHWRQWVAIIHQYLGLGVALILIIVGLTGSVLVFEQEIDHFLLNLQVEKIVPSGQMINPDLIVNQVRNAYQDQPDLTVSYVEIPQKPNDSYKVWLLSKTDKSTEVVVNPYTGKILGNRQWEQTLIGIIYQLHYQLLAGDFGVKLVGVCGLVLFILSITGILLWPGWRRLLTGFKIKFDAHPQRLNFDLHKVIGILTAGFLALLAFTGFCWNFNEIMFPTIYAVTFSSPPPDSKSTLISGKPPLTLSQIIQKADAALPNTVTTYIDLPSQPDGIFSVNKRFPKTNDSLGLNRIYFDQYSGEILYFKDVRSLSLGQQVIDSFVPLHYGTFAGLPSRILYVLIGLSPTCLAVTGFLMGWYRRQRKKLNIEQLDNPIFSIENRQMTWPLSPWPWF